MTLSEKFVARLTKLAALSDHDTATLESDLVAEFEKVDALAKNAENVGVMTAIAEAHDTVTGEQQKRLTRDGMRQMTTARTASSTAAPPADSPAAFNAQRGAQPRPPAASSGVLGRGTLRDRYRNEIADARGLADVLTAALKDANGAGRTVAFTASWKDAYPEDRKLTGDPMTDSARLDKQQAVVASAGVCNPVAVDYAVDGIAVGDRPLRDGLPGFLGDRGGLRFVTPVQLASTASATGIWPEALDVNPGTATKPILQLTCPSEQEIFVDAVPTRIKIGNMQGRFFPEWVQNFTLTSLAAAARTAELNLLQKISTGSMAVSSGQLLGASRDFVATIEQATAAARYRQRARDDHPFTVILPSWAKSMMRADLARELAHDDAGSDPLAITDARIASWFSTRSIRPIWTMDGLSAVTGGAGQVPFAAQSFGTQAAGSALLDWPRQLVWWIFPSGSWQYLDGGRLDLGVVRDSTLNATNDWEIFVEVFETVAFRGLESLQVVSALRPNGSSAGTVSTSTY